MKEKYRLQTPILCDISKAFDRVWHTGLLLKLKAYGVDGKLFKSGITDAVIHCVGNSNLKSDKLNKRERETQTVLHVFLSI
jgi:hypothetical protein